MGKKTILVVDDEQDMLILIKAFLENEDYKVVTASDGIKALGMLESVKPDLVLLDMMMPFLTGKEVCMRIRKNPNTKNTKVIFLTVLTLNEFGRNDLKDLCVLDFITKPFDLKEASEKIKKALKTK